MKTRQTISTTEAASAIGRSRFIIEKSMRKGTFPVGTCFKTQAGRFVYIIPKDAFDRFMQGEISGRKGWDE